MAHPAAKTSVAKKLSLKLYHPKTPIVTWFAKRVLSINLALLSLNYCSFPKARITLFPLKVSYKSEMIGDEHSISIR